MKSPTQAHDHFFKHLFSEPRIVLSYLKGSLPESWFSRLLPETLQRVADSYVDDELREQLSDVVYQCQLRDRPHQVSLVFLLEHKSYVPRYPHLQLLRYMLNLWQKQIQAGGNLQPIIPMVVYHGRQKWEIKTFREYFSWPDEPWLNSFIPTFSYHLTNLRQDSSSQIEQQYDTLVLRKAFLLMKWIFDKGLTEHTERIFTELFALPADQPESKYFRIFITYLTNSPNPEKNQAMAKLKSLAEEWDVPPDSIAHQWYQEIEQKGIEKGIEKGMEKGIEKGFAKAIRLNVLNMQKKGVEPEQIAFLLDMPLAEVLEMIQQEKEV